MRRHGHQSPSLTSWPPPPRRASTALDVINDAPSLSTATHNIPSQDSASRNSVPLALSPSDINYTSTPAQPSHSAIKSIGQNALPSVSDNETYRERVNQVIQNFFLKAAMIIIQQRIPVSPLFASKTNTKKVNKWFNLDLDDTDAFRDELSTWKQANVYQQSISPLVIETYIDTQDLTANQSLVIFDDKQKRWNVEQSINNIVGSNTRARRNDVRPTDGRPDIILERWTVEMKQRKEGVNVPELPIAYKHGVIFFRTLYTYAGLLPAQRLLRKLAKSKGAHGNLKVCCRIAGQSAAPSSTDGLNVALIDNEISVTDTYSFGAVDTPAGEMHVSVSYRKQCDFRVDDSEASLSSHFINLDEHYFQPSLHRHRGSPPPQHPHITSEIGNSVSIATMSSRPKMTENEATRGGALKQSDNISSSPNPLSLIHQASSLSGTSPGHGIDMLIRPVHAASSIPKGGDLADISRRPSVPFMQPFKSPSLSNSPSDALSASPRTSVTRISSTNAAPIQARARPVVSPVVSKSSLSYDPSPALGTSASPRPQSMGRYSSSFGPRKSRPTFSNGRIDDDNSSGRASYSSSIAAPGSTIFQDSPSGAVASHDDQKVADFLKLLDEKQPVKLFNHGDSSNKTYSALNKFQRMKESYNVLSDSMTNSMSVNRSQPTSLAQSPPVPNPSYSPSTSPGKLNSPFPQHAPNIPSRLSSGHTVESGNDRLRLGHAFASARESTDAHSELAGIRTTMTSPLDIPSSPRPFRNHGPDSFSTHQHRKFAGSYVGEQAAYSPQLDVSGSPESAHLSPGKLIELRQASDDRFSGSRRLQGVIDTPGQTHRQTSAYTSVPRSSISHTRQSIHNDQQSSVSSPGFANDRPSVSARHPSYSRSGFTEEEDLLFAMSDMMGRRSIDQDHSSSYRNEHSRQTNP